MEPAQEFNDADPKSVFERHSCDHCGSKSIILDAHSNEFVCSSCGCVDERQPSMERLNGAILSPDHVDTNRTGIQQSLAIHQKGLSTLIGIDDTDARGKMLDPAQRNSIQRLRTWNNRSLLNDSVSRNLDKALKFLNNFGSKLYLSQAVIESAAYIYRKAATRKLAKGRSTLGLVGGSLYAACRENATPKTITDVAATCNLTTRDVMAHYKIILKELSLSMPVLQSIDYVTLVANRLRMSEKTKRDALNIFNRLEKQGMVTGKNPRALAGAVIYIAAQENNDYVRQVEICQVADISTVSLRKRCKEIKSNLGRRHVDKSGNHTSIERAV